MGTSERASAAALLALAVSLAPVRAQEAPHPPRAEVQHPPRAEVQHAPRAEAPHPLRVEVPHACLNQKERRALVQNGTVLHLAAAMHSVRSRIPGTLVRARLCHRGEGFAYVLTVLAHDGKVTRVVVDAAKGTLVGER